MSDSPSLPVIPADADEPCETKPDAGRSHAEGKTEVGSYFISNYPPFSQWKQDDVPKVLNAFENEPGNDVPLGLYMHIPFCRKRCKFCYFRVYTKQNAQTIRDYVDRVCAEVAMLHDKPGVGGRKLDFVYFGGGTPSYLSSKQLVQTHDRLTQWVNWDNAAEVTFECEPGTLNEEKVKTLKEIGITRISLGVENFDDTILEANGRAHLSPEVWKAWDWIQAADFPQTNVDLIAGMIGENDDNWHDCVSKVIDLRPQNVTIYQMELPFNTVISKEMREQGIDSPIADWPTKRRWAKEAFERLVAAGYSMSSGNEAVLDAENDRFVYRDNLFRGSDILATGVSSFGHFQGIHYQNLDQIGDYMSAVTGDESNAPRLPINRALQPTDQQVFIREWILQMKEGVVPAEPFRQKFGKDPLEEFAEPIANQTAAGFVEVVDDVLRLTTNGLLQADSLLPEYFEPQHRAVRYT